MAQLPEVHASAVVETTRIGEGAVIGPFCVIGPEVTLGAGVRLGSHVVANGNSRDRCRHGGVLGSGAGEADGSSRHALSPAIPPGRSTMIGEGCSVGVHAIVYEDVDVGAGTLLGDFCVSA